MRKILAPILFAMALLAAPGTHAQSACSASERFAYSFNSSASATLNYASSYSWNATNGSGATRSFTVSFVTNGLTGSSSVPVISDVINDGAPSTGRNLIINATFVDRTSNINGSSNIVVTTISLAQPVLDLTIQLNDIDADRFDYRDWLRIIGRNGATTVVPSITTPHGTDNASGPKTAANSHMQLGASSSPLVVGVDEALGNSNDGSGINRTNNGTLTMRFAAPVTSVELRFANSPQDDSSDADAQAFGIEELSFCPAIDFSVSKSSSSLATTGDNRFAIPGAEKIYAITLTNTGSAAIDVANLVVLDTLPPQAAFYAGNFGGSVVGPFDFTASGGASIANGSATFSSDGVNFTYTPASLYDANVRAIRMTGTGTVPVGGAMTVRFRVRIN